VRAVLGTRPYIRPLLVALQRCPAYRVAVVEARHAWLFSIAGDEIETVSAPVSARVGDSGLGGWYGLEAYRVQQVVRLARHDYRDTAAMLEQVMRHGEQEPLVIGGHDDGVRHLLGSLPPIVPESFAGSFAADMHTLTPARARELAAPLVARWAEQRAQHLAGEILAMPPGDLVAIDLSACLGLPSMRAP
jgi:Bacterial archaeo-eukaryotic release factor family 10